MDVTKTSHALPKEVLPKTSTALLVLILMLVGITQSCNPTFDPLAPEKEVGVVFGVLSPHRSAQHIRVAKAFLLEGDALAYAANNDLSVRDKTVRLLGSNGTEHIAIPNTTLPKDSNGVFQPGQVVYTFITDDSGPGRERLEAGVTYTLEVGTPDADDFLFAHTRIPPTPEIRDNLLIQRGQGSLRCLPKFDLRLPLDITWLKVDAGSYEVRSRLMIERTGVPDTITWGPSPLVTGSKSCFNGHDRVCFRFTSRQLLEYFKSRMPAGGVNYTYDIQDSCVVNPANDPAVDDQLPKVFEFEVTAIDSALTRYMIATNSGVLDLSASRPEYTNIQGNIEAVGIFGSFSWDKKYAVMNMCSEWYLGLNDRLQPAACEGN